MAAILFTPTLIAAIYGMNFRSMPELDQPWGYPAALAAMFLLGAAHFSDLQTPGLAMTGPAGQA